jgi:hypothetical protein
MPAFWIIMTAVCVLFVNLSWIWDEINFICWIIDRNKYVMILGWVFFESMHVSVDGRQTILIIFKAAVIPSI